MNRSHIYIYIYIYIYNIHSYIVIANLIQCSYTLLTWCYHMVSICHEHYFAYMLNVEYTPNMDEPLKEIAPVNLEITVCKYIYAYYYEISSLFTML